MPDSMGAVMADFPVNSSSPGRGVTLELTEAEVARRVEILKRFRELLKAQRDRFRSYLDVLEKQKEVIEDGTPEELLSHVELEEKIVADIFSIQKVIDPLEDMYRSLSPGPGAGKTVTAGEEDISGLKSALEELKTEAAVRSERNRELLSKRMVELRSEIKSLRSNPYLRNRPGAGAPNASLINIQG